jgi:DNA-binding MarR family transcriptional regulator
MTDNPVFMWAWMYPDLTPSQRLILMSFAEGYREDGTCDIPMKFTRQRFNLKHPTYKRIIGDLIEMGLLSKQDRSQPNGRPDKPIYYLHIKNPQAECVQ